MTDDNKKIIDNNFLSKAKNALDRCITIGANTDSGIRVMYEGAKATIKVTKQLFEVDDFSQTLDACCKINRWECVLKEISKEKCTDVLSTLDNEDHQITIKIRDVKITDFDPTLNPFLVNKDTYNKYSDKFTLTCPDAPDCTV